jgi:hypothetical protein
MRTPKAVPACGRYFTHVVSQGRGLGKACTHQGRSLLGYASDLSIRRISPETTGGQLIATSIEPIVMAVEQG